ncbi:ATP-binding protein [Phenylobacterium sp.]|uniref:ATP-binding protein n=1 Tax=Phenylobacterium sp. TaxID=1871053 RepID=UPI0025E9E386|nr:ATP-binding protein [Phenylobacterium sp.]
MTSAIRAAATGSTSRSRSTKSPTSELITIGKDVLELLSSAMYVDPLTIYREYIQNAADAIDDARRAGVLSKTDAGRVDININPVERSILIRDNGSGIAADRAAATLLSIGASGKRGTDARGFRGVGRLAGLAYCRVLTFRTRAAANEPVVEVAWDCVKLKSTLRDVTQTDDLPGVMKRIVSISELDGSGYPEHFFEVELTQVVRLRRDALLSAPQIETYLAQVAPVPFAREFRYAEKITAHLDGHVRMADLQIKIGAEGAPITRPYRDRFAVTDTVQDDACNVELLTFEGEDGLVAVGWLMHHSYLGHISTKSQVGGLRLRAGNVQIGAASLADEVFPEARFNGWCIGEIHVIDRRVLPNARRDDFEQNIHYANLLAELGPLGRAIAKRCRDASVARHRAREERVQSEAAEVPRPLSAGPSEGGQAVARSDLLGASFAASADRVASMQAADGELGLVEKLIRLIAASGATRAEVEYAFGETLRRQFDKD